MSDAIIKALRMDIASGRLELGAKLPTERALAAHFGVSQPTIREAVRALEVMGLLESRHGSGVYVTRSTRDFVTSTLETLLQMERVHMLDAFNVRRVLGMYSASLACEHATDRDLKAMRDAMTRCDEAQDVQTIAESIVAFQVAFSAGAHNPLLFALETFLIRMLMQFQLMANGRKGKRFWRKQADYFAPHRHRMHGMLEAHDRDGVLAEWEAYLDDQFTLFSTDPNLADVTLSDPDSIRTVDEIVLNMPSYGFTAD
ncbi:FadR/GntR family transcriptional regulator [Micromonospora sp. NPDC005299]|uniref:FadR/GntR family transcriptional regulator n=1 Tax=Micromonospora sp. NPDC005299 TaxID=3364231 RepID=UPI003695D398